MSELSVLELEAQQSELLPEREALSAGPWGHSHFDTHISFGHGHFGSHNVGGSEHGWR